MDDQTQSTELQVLEENQMEKFQDVYTQLLGFIKSQLKEGTDFGIIPKTNKKTLFQPGAEKIAFFFRFTIDYQLVDQKEDWETGLFYYKYKCIVSTRDGRFVSAAERTCSSFEKKYLIGSSGEKYATESQKQRMIDRVQKEGKGGQKYWVITYRKDATELYDIQNTIISMAQKRALVAAIRTATMATDIFSDSEDLSQPDPQRKHYSNYKPKDPGFNRMQNKVFAMGAERGIDNEELKAHVKKKYSVESFNDLSSGQLQNYCDYLLNTYEVVGKGQTPKPIKQTSQSAETGQVMHARKAPSTPAKPRDEFKEKYNEFKSKHDLS